jgi:hypothetical protein
MVATRVGDNNIAHLITYCHATLFSPVFSTLLKAVKAGYLVNFPGLTTQRLQRHPPTSIATAKGHIDQARLRPAGKTNAPMVEAPADSPSMDDQIPESLDDTRPTEMCFVSYLSKQDFNSTFHTMKGKIYLDQTGRFPLTSARGNNYILLAYCYDLNAIIVEPIPTRKETELTKALERIYRRLQRAGVRPTMHVLDNECPAGVKHFLESQTTQFQRVPAHNHRRNAAGRASRTFKAHFITGLCSTDPDFPLCLWDELLPQAELTLNLLRGSRLNPRISAWNALQDVYDFHAHPLGPPGCKVVILDPPNHRASWDAHGKEGWYVGPSMEHYCVYRICVKDTKRIWFSERLQWFPRHVTMPALSTHAQLEAAIHDLAAIIRRWPSHPPLEIGTDSLLRTLRDTLEILTGKMTTDPTSLAQRPSQRQALSTQSDPVAPESTTYGVHSHAPAATQDIDPPSHSMLAARATPSATTEVDDALDTNMSITGKTPSATTEVDDALDTSGPTLAVYADTSEPASLGTSPTISVLCADTSEPASRGLVTGATPSATTEVDDALATNRGITGATPSAIPEVDDARDITSLPSVSYADTSEPARLGTDPKLLTSVADTFEPASQDVAMLSPSAYESEPAGKAGPTTANTFFSFVQPTAHCALHSTAMNPDTNRVAEYRELASSSDGYLWAASNAEEIYRLANGKGDIIGHRLRIQAVRYPRHCYAHTSDSAEPKSKSALTGTHRN